MTCVHLLFRSRGFGFVTYCEESSVDACQAARPHLLDGKQVETKRATSKDELVGPADGKTVSKVRDSGCCTHLL